MDGERKDRIRHKSNDEIYYEIIKIGILFVNKIIVP